MNKLIGLSSTGIEYGDYTWNFASGCGNNLDGKCKSGGFKCWAYSITQRFGRHYPNGFKPTIYPEAFCSPIHLRKPSRILCAFMGDLFWECPEFNPDKEIHATMPSGKASVTMSLKGWIFTTIKQCPQHDFLFLTKQPQNLIKFSPFPDNCWVGVTATNREMFTEACSHLIGIKATVKFISLEPLLQRILLPEFGEWGKEPFDWVIIGAQTKPYKPPKIEWVQEIVDACDKAGIPMFLKDNLSPILKDLPESCIRWSGWGEGTHRALRQEMPVCQKPQ